jgi:riboflavin synthase
MFSGLIQALGKVEGRRGGILTLQAPKMKLKLGDSLAVNGVCLTVMKKAGEGRRLSFELSEETLARTTLGNLPAGTPVNIERTLTLADGLGGQRRQLDRRDRLFQPKTTGSHAGQCSRNG